MLIFKTRRALCWLVLSVSRFGSSKAAYPLPLPFFLGWSRWRVFGGRLGGPLVGWGAAFNMQFVLKDAVLRF
jgi:hypothetical protein